MRRSVCATVKSSCNHCAALLKLSRIPAWIPFTLRRMFLLFRAARFAGILQASLLRGRSVCVTREHAPPFRYLAAT